jgi:hypothetical protein
MALHPKSPRFRRALALALAMALTGTMAACGDDDDASDEGMVIQSDADGPLGGDDDDFGDDAGDGPATPEDLGIELSDCTLSISAVGQVAASLTMPTETGGAEIDTLADLVPDGLQSEVTVLSDAIDEMQSAFADADVEAGDPAGADAVVEENRDVLDPARDAMDDIEEHFMAACDPG